MKGEYSASTARNPNNANDLISTADTRISESVPLTTGNEDRSTFLQFCICPKPAYAEDGDTWTCPKCGKHYTAREKVVWEESFEDSADYLGFTMTPTQPLDLGMEERREL